MIKPDQFTQQMIDLQKTSFLSFYKAASTMQKQASSAMDLVLNQVPWIPNEGRQAISDWMGTCQQEGDRFKTYVEQSFANAGIYFSPETLANKTAKTEKPSVAKAKKAPTTEPKKAVAGSAKKAAPEVTKKAAPVETKPAKTIPVKKADVPKK